MTVLAINGFPVPLAVGSGDVDSMEIGSRERMDDGTLLTTRNALKDSIDVATSWLDPEQALALRGLLLGRGDRWSFDEGDWGPQYSAKKRPPNGSPVYGVRTGPEVLAVSDVLDYDIPKLGTGCVEVGAACTNLFDQNIRTGTDTSSNTTGFTNIGVASTFASSTAAHWQGSRALSIVTAVTVGSGLRANYAAAAGSTDYAGSVYLKAASGSPVVRVFLKEVTGGSANGTPVYATLSTTKWKRVECNITTGGGVSAIGLHVDNSTGVIVSFYADGFQLEQRTFATTWADPSRAAGQLYYTMGELKAGDDLTLMCWTRGGHGSSPVLLYVGTTADGLRILDNGNFEVVSYVGGANQASFAYESSPFTGAWHHVAVVMRRNPQSGSYALELYVDGAQVGHASPTLPALPTGSVLYVGNDPAGSNPWNGLVDELVVLPYGLTASMIAAMYASVFSDLPSLNVTGDLDGSIEMVGGGVKLTHTVGAINGTLHSRVIRVSGKLEER